MIFIVSEMDDDSEFVLPEVETVPKFLIIYITSEVVVIATRRVFNLPECHISPSGHKY